MIANFLVCFALGYFEWVLQEDLYNHYAFGIPLSQEAVHRVAILEYLAAGFILISTGFLADALRRFRKRSII